MKKKRISSPMFSKLLRMVKKGRRDDVPAAKERFTPHMRRETMISVIVILGSLVAASAALFFLVGDLRGRTEIIRSTREAIERRSGILSALTELTETAPDAERYERRMKELLPTEDQLFEFSSWLEGAARSRGLDLDFSFRGSERDATLGGTGSASFSLVIQGAYDVIVEFVKFLELSGQRYLIGLDTLQVSRATRDYTALVNGRVFFRQAGTANEL